MSQLAQNRRARFDYHILETFEAGLVLTGGEIKSIRGGEVSLEEAYVRPSPDGGELFLVSAHIRQYNRSADQDYDPIRPRKLLLHKREILKLVRAVAAEGLTIVALDLHLKDGRLKLALALAKGKKNVDRRETIKERESKRDIARALSRK